MKKGFTLAEILIVLTIVGIMAVMTIPSLVQNANEQQKITLFKKGYNAVVNAYATEFAVKTPPSKWTITTSSDGGRKVFEALANQLNVKYYAHWDKQGKFETLEKKFEKPKESYEPTLYWIITEDEIGYFMNTNNENRLCPKKLEFIKNSTSSINAKNDYSCMKIIVDINGPFRGPNKVCGEADLGIEDKDDIKNLPKCEQFYLFPSTEGITAGNPDTMIAAKILEQ